MTDPCRNCEDRPCLNGSWFCCEACRRWYAAAVENGEVPDLGLRQRKSMQGRHLAPEMYAAIEAHLRAGLLSHTKIALELDVSQPTVSKLADRLGIPPLRPTIYPQIDRGMLWDLHGQGLTPRQIAKRMHCRQASVTEIIREGR